MPDVLFWKQSLWVEIQVSGIEAGGTISEDDMKRIKNLVDTRPEIILFILEDLMSHLLNEEEKGQIIRGALIRWKD
ncbi:unnamed protein product, partial [marine sediment metagenome]